MSHRHLGRVSILITVSAIAGLCAVYLAGDTHQNPSPLMSPARSRAPGSAALRAYLNPETGKVDVGVLSAAAQLDPDTEQALRRDAIGLSEERRADGTVLIDLQGRFQSVAVVHRSADGKNTVCVDSEDRARKTLQGDLAASRTPEVK